MYNDNWQDIHCCQFTKRVNWLMEHYIILRVQLIHISRMAANQRLRQKSRSTLLVRTRYKNDRITPKWPGIDCRRPTANNTITVVGEVFWVFPSISKYHYQLHYCKELPLNNNLSCSCARRTHAVEDGLFLWGRFATSTAVRRKAMTENAAENISEFRLKVQDDSAPTRIVQMLRRLLTEEN